MFRKKQETLHRFDSMRRTTCSGCPAGCGVKVFVRDGRISDIYGDEEHPTNKGSFCPKGMLTYFHLANPNRLTEPRMRESLTNDFRKVTWEEAIAFVSERLSEIATTHGKESVYIHGSEIDPFDYLAGATWFANHFGTPYAPPRFFPGPFTSAGIVKTMFGIPASTLLMNPPRDWCHSRCILLYGCDLAASDPMTFGPLVDARDRGATLLAIDSRNTVTASKASFALRVKPGSRSLALKGILHLLMRKGMIDEEFLVESTQDFASLKSEMDGYPPETVARDCWVDPREIAHMADLIGGTNPLQIIAGDWNSRRCLSDEDLFLCAALVCLKGSVGVPGGGVNFLNTSPFLWESWDQEKSENWATSERQAFSINLEDLLPPQSGKAGALICRGNPCARLADGKRTKAALREMPLIVHLSSYPNETFNHAHVSFPMSSWMEYSGLVAANNGRAIQWQHKVVEPPGACRSSLEFWTALANANNLGGHCPWSDGKGSVDFRKAADFFLAKNPLTQAICAEDLDPETNPPGGMLWPCVDPSEMTFENSRLIKGNVRGLNILFQRGRNYPLADRRFPTASGKIIFPASIRMEKSGESRARKDLYPLMLMTGVLVDTVDEFGYFVTDRRLGSNVPILKIHPRLGNLIGVSNGEPLTVESDKGAFTAPAWLSDDVDPRTIWCPEGIDPYQPFFACESPRSLFDHPSADPASSEFARVTLYTAQSDRESTRELISRFVEELESGT